MQAWMLRRLAKLILVVWGALTVVFFVGRALPVDPAVALSGPGATPEMISATREALRLDDPLITQYLAYFADLLRGDLGRSALTGRAVKDDLAARLPASAELVTVAFGGAVLAAAILAVGAAARPNGIADRLGRALTFAGTAVPMFFMGVLLILIFYVYLGIAPAPFGRLGSAVAAPSRVTGLLIIDSILAVRWDALVSSLHHLVCPALALALSIFPQVFQVLKSAIGQALRHDALIALEFARIPRALYWRRYVLPLALGPFLSLLAASYGYMIGGTVLIEHIFGWNGIGSYAVQAIGAGDYNAVQGVVLVGALTYALAFFAADALMRHIDPRLQSEEDDARARPGA